MTKGVRRRAFGRFFWSSTFWGLIMLLRETEHWIRSFQRSPARKLPIDSAVRGTDTFARNGNLRYSECLFGSIGINA